MKKTLSIKLGWLDIIAEQKLRFALVPFIQRALLASRGSCVRDVEVRLPDDYRYVFVDLDIPVHASQNERLCKWVEAWAIGFVSGILVVNEIEILS